MKDKAVAYLCWCAAFFGVCGLQRFYVGKNGTGLLWLFTFGLLGIGQLIDLFTLGGQVENYNLRQAALGMGGQTLNVNVQSLVGAGAAGGASLDISPLRSALRKLDKLYVADLIEDDEYAQRKKTLLRTLAESIYDSNPEDGLLASSRLVDEGLLSQDEYRQIKAAVL
ncbi:MAG: NINE protein [Rhodothermales bacterium]|nr:NINE protein [Rhodothermales bacterium]